MNNLLDDLNKQFFAFYDSSSIFEKSYKEFGLFDFYPIDKSYDIKNLEINEKLPLGKRVERFFEYYLNHCSSYAIIKQNLQIIKNNVTLGELDFIVFNKKLNQFEHIELVYKYYLYDDRFKKELDRYVGPNRDDSFIQKLTKLKEKQFPLLYKTETKEYISDIKLNNIKQKVCFMANVYLPFNMKNEKVPYINNSCIKGYYISYSQFLIDKAYTNYEYYIPHRYEWLLDASICNSWYDFNTVKKEVEFFINLKKSPLIWLKKGNMKENVFIVWW